MSKFNSNTLIFTSQKGQIRDFGKFEKISWISTKLRTRKHRAQASTNLIFKYSNKTCELSSQTSFQEIFVVDVCALFLVHSRWKFTHFHWIFREKSIWVLPVRSTQKHKIFNKMAYFLSSRCISYNSLWYWSINPSLKFKLKQGTF